MILEIFKKPIYISGTKNGRRSIECAIKWNACLFRRNVMAFTNNIHQKDGGTHLLGYRSALTRMIK